MSSVLWEMFAYLHICILYTTICSLSAVTINFVSTGKSFSGREFDAMTAAEQAEACATAKLFSRVEPAHKSKIVDYLQKDGSVAAMVRGGLLYCQWVLS